MRTKLLTSSLLLTSLLFSACIDRGQQLGQMTTRQLSANSHQAAISAQNDSNQIDSLNQEMKGSLLEVKANLAETKKQRKNIGR